LAAGEQGLLVGGERRFGVIRVGGDGLTEFGSVEHGEVGTLAGERGHQGGGVAEQGDAGAALPAVADRQGVDPPRDRCAVGIADECPQALVPVGEVLQHGCLGVFGAGIGEVDT
jgi:hypothetical protein